MENYRIFSARELLAGNPYVGRGILVGRTPNARRAVVAYFIMGRSANSRNRIFCERDGAVFTEPFDPARVEDPSLIIYAALRSYENRLIVTNGDQTDTVYQALAEGKGFFEALTTRAFEPDAPNFTPRISAMLTFGDNDFTYDMSILKSVDADGSACARYGFSYPAVPGLGHFIHTYQTDGSPLPTFWGEPERVAVSDDIDEMTDEIWSNLSPDNRISLYVRYIDLADKTTESRLINRNK